MQETINLPLLNRVGVHQQIVFVSIPEEYWLNCNYTVLKHFILYLNEEYAIKSVQ